MENKKLAVAYIRRSSHNQIHNQSFEVQKQTIIEFAHRKGFYLPDNFIFEDDAVSAYKKAANKRQGMNQMKKVVLEKDVSGIIFYDFSRIDRKIYSFVSDFYYDVVQKKPYLMFFTTTKEDEWTPADLDVKLQLIIANAESHDKSRRAVDSQRKDLMGEVAKRPGSTVPFGYKQLDKKLIPDENTAAIVLFIFHLYSWGHSMQNIAELLNEANVVSPKGKGWGTSTIENILKNEVYAGHLKWNLKHQVKSENLIESTHEPIVPHVFYNTIEKNRELKNKFLKLDTPFLLSSLVYCEDCGRPLTHRNSSTKKKNVKYEYSKYQCEQCNYEVEANSLHQRVLEHVKPQFSSSMLINQEAFLDKIKSYIQGLHIKLERIKDKEQICDRQVKLNTFC